MRDLEYNNEISRENRISADYCQLATSVCEVVSNAA